MNAEQTKEYDFSVLPQKREDIETFLADKYQNALQCLSSLNYQQGIKSLKQILEYDIVKKEFHELSYQCCLHLAMAYEKLKQNREAIMYYYKCVSIKENDFTIWSKLSDYCMRLHYFEQAEYCYQNCLNCVPSFLYEDILHEKMVYTAFFMKNYTVCKERIDFLVARNYKKAELLLLKSIVARIKGNIIKAENFRREALELDPTISEDQLLINQAWTSEPELLSALDRNPYKQEYDIEFPKEISMAVDKYNWEAFLKEIKSLLKMCYLSSQELPLSKKLQKSNPIKVLHGIENKNYQTIMFSPFKIIDKKDKRTPKILDKVDEEVESIDEDDNGNSGEFERTEKKYTSFILDDDSNSDHKPFTIIREDKKKKRKSVTKDEVKEDSSGQRSTKTSKKKKNPKPEKASCNVSLESILSNYKFKNDLKFDELIDTYKENFLYFNNIKSDEEILSLHPLGQKASQYEEAGGNKSMSSPAKEKISRASNEDFTRFLQENHNRNYPNIILFSGEILTHFLQNKRRDLPRELQNVPLFFDAKASLGFCPSYHLTDYKKKIIIKLYLYCSHFCENILTDYSSKLTMFELLLDYYQFKNSITVKETETEKHSEQIKRLQAALTFISQSLLFDELGLEDKKLEEACFCLLKVRSILAFSRLFLTEDFKCTTSARGCLQILAQELRALDIYMELNTQMIENNIYVNMFWMRDNLLKSEQIEILTSKLKENEIKEYAYIRNGSGDNIELNDKQTYLEGLFKIFEEKGKDALDSAIETYYKKIYQKMTGLKLKEYVLYLEKLFKIFLNILSQPNQTEDGRKVLIHAYQQLKIKELLGILGTHLEKQKKIRKQVEKDENFAFKISNLTNFLYKMIVINNVIDYMLDFELFLSLFFKIGQILVRRYSGSEPVSSQLKFFKLSHWLIHLVPNDKVTKYHIELVKSSYRQETTLQALSYLVDKYGYYSENESQTQSQGTTLKDIIENEVIAIFACWYGIGSANDIEDKETFQGIKSLLDIVILYKFIVYFYPKYLKDPAAKFRNTISKTIIDIYDYLKDHQEEWWDLCEGFQDLKQKFDQKLEEKVSEGKSSSGKTTVDEEKSSIEPSSGEDEKKSEESDSEMSVESDTSPVASKKKPGKMEIELEARRDNGKTSKKGKSASELCGLDLKSDDCFCRKRTCFNDHFKNLTGRDFRQTFSQIFCLIGKALEDTKIQSDKSDTAKLKKLLLRIEKMHSISASFYPNDPYICNELAANMIDQYILYSDQLIYDKGSDKFPKLEKYLQKAENLLSCVRDMIATKRFTTFFKDMDVGDVYARALMNLKITKILELIDLKYKLHIAYSSAEENLIKSTKAHIDIIRKDLESYPLDKAYEKDYYLSGTMIYNFLPKVCSCESHQSLVENVIQLCEIVENASSDLENTSFDKNLLSLYELEAETHLFVLLYKIFRRYINLIKYVYSDTFGKKIQKKLEKESKTFTSLDKFKKYILSDFSEFMKFLEREKKIRFQLRRTTFEGKTSVDKAAKPDENIFNKTLGELAAEETGELGNMNGFLANYLAEVSEDDKYLKKARKDIDLIIEKGLFEVKMTSSIGEVLKSAEPYFIGITKKLREISQRKESKKFKGAVFHVKCQLYSGQIFDEYFKDNKKALDIIGQLLAGKGNEVVELCRYEKDPELSLVYNRDLFFLRNKHKVLESYIRLSCKSYPKESYEKCKLLNKKVYGLILVPEKEKKNEKICMINLRIYEMTLGYMIDFLEKNIDKIIVISSKKEGIQEENGEKSLEHLENVMSETLKNELKILHEIIANNIRSRNVAPIMKKNAKLYKKITDILILYYEHLAAKCGVEVNQDKKLESSIAFFDQIFKKKKAVKKEDAKKDDDGTMVD